MSHAQRCVLSLLFLECTLHFRELRLCRLIRVRGGDRVFARLCECRLKLVAHACLQ